MVSDQNVFYTNHICDLKRLFSTQRFSNAVLKGLICDAVGRFLRQVQR